MQIVCPNCATSYVIDPAAVGQTGRTVRCTRCKSTWFAGVAKAAPDVAAFAVNVAAQAEIPTTAPPSVPDVTPPPAEIAADMESPAAPVEPVRRDDALVPLEAEAAEPPAITDSPPLVPPIEQAPLPESAKSDGDEDIESFAARRQRLQVRRKEKRRSSRWTAVILVLAAFNVAVIGARDEVVRYLPQTASFFSAIGLPVNLRHLKFEDVKITREGQDGVNLLIVHGMIASTAGRPTEVPRLRFAARNATGQEIYVWTALPSRSVLAPGERLEFTSQLASPPAEANDVLVRFFTAQDATAGIK